MKHESDTHQPTYVEEYEFEHFCRQIDEIARELEEERHEKEADTPTEVPKS